MRFRRKRVVTDGAGVPPALEPAVDLGRLVQGERALPVRSGRLVWPIHELRRHGVIFGASGSGKSETALRIVSEVARHTDDQVFYLDAKGSRETAERFVGLMEAAGRKVRVFPNEPMDLWRGDWRGVSNRLLEVVPYATVGPASWYRDIAKLVLQMACRFPDGPPRSSRQLLDRLDWTELGLVHRGTSAMKAVDPDQVASVRVRYEAFFGQLHGSLDGAWGFDEVDAGYMLLDSVSLGEDACGSASMIFSDFAHYFKERKPGERGCVLVVDEFSAIASSSEVAMRVEQARAYRAAMVLLPQTRAGMGGVEQASRILGAVGTVLAHGTNEPEEIAVLGGTKSVLEVSHRIEEGEESGTGMARLVERPRLHPDSVRRLGVGEAWVIRGGKVGKVAVERAPLVTGALPVAADIGSELPAPASKDPVEIPF